MIVSLKTFIVSVFLLKMRSRIIIIILAKMYRREKLVTNTKNSIIKSCVNLFIIYLKIQSTKTFFDSILLRLLNCFVFTKRILLFYFLKMWRSCWGRSLSCLFRFQSIRLWLIGEIIIQILFAVQFFNSNCQLCITFNSLEIKYLHF